MLLKNKKVTSLLRCPRSNGLLALADNETTLVVCEDPARQYKIINGFPIMIDFAASVFKASQVSTRREGSAVTRKQYSGLSRLLKRIVAPNKRSTSKNVATLRSLLKRTLGETKRILVVGGGSIGQGMAPLYSDPDLEIVAFDVYGSEHVQFVADAHQIPLADASFDCVIVQAVLEHVLDPHRVVSEIHRVLKIGGLVYSETPFLQHVHEGPYDFTRFTDSGHRYLFRAFELIKSGSSGSAGTQLLWSLDYFFRSVFRSRFAGKVAKVLFFWVRLFDRAIPPSYSIDAASGNFFLGRKHAGHKMEPSEIIGYYQGAQ
ncbi:MAG: class I SAM-dependent methyltransferase [Phycisphaerae bacterium]|jgi:SAM-dependent methyltransferase/uncharacterized protein YbaR (Trm112 family)|nr:class I SAM-dependent methyltransferase [Phycisphaerae bacterium]MBT5657270.1 class I SAM-dependent methyltransferase [Phycisphaerae bacterium]